MVPGPLTLQASAVGSVTQRLRELRRLEGARLVQYVQHRCGVGVAEGQRREVPLARTSFRIDVWSNT